MRAVILAHGAVALASVAAASDARQCEACHSEIVEGYRGTGMGRSMRIPWAGQPTGVYRHGHSGTTFQVSPAGDGVVQEVRRGGLSARYEVEFVIGSGNAAFGYLVRAGDALFQSPVTFYTELGRWGMAPGMERDPAPDFTRPVTPECLWCHAGRPRHVPGTVNSYEDGLADPPAISCERCHGPPDRHLREPARGSIFNPASASPRERDSVCEQCHLGGVIRVLNPGQTFGSFQPGRRLEQSWSVFLGQPEAGAAEDRFQVVSHVEQLALSACAQGSGDRFWCGTCHDPHQAAADPKPYFSERCVECHAEGLSEGHAGLGSDCISCHMPRRRSHDSGHSAFTDHRIARRPASRPDPPPPSELRPWKPVPGVLARRNLGIAHILQGQEQGSFEMIRRGAAQLRDVLDQFPEDVAVLDALGTALVMGRVPREGLRLLETAVRTGRARALQYNALAAARLELGDKRGAEAALEEAIRLEPTLESSYRMLAKVHRDAGNSSRERDVWLRLRGRRPRLLDPQLRLQQRGSAPAH